ncbi:MAG TPA: hypothetical protein VMU81_27410 [Acetobacteraceae bacterium]|nr:hypothetical protein [Acetobacteraceae bacterium]
MRGEIARRDAAVRAAQREAAAARAEAARAAAAPPLAITPPPPAVVVQAAPPPPAPPAKLGVFHTGGLTITLGGFIEAAGIFRSLNETSDISSTFSGIPLANTPQGHESELRFSARQSRFTALVEGQPDDVTTIAGYGEIDLQGAAPTANSNESNSYTPRLRQAYATYDRSDWGVNILAGQAWSLLTLDRHGITPREEVLPLVIDGQYVVGFTWARQPELRVVKQLMDDHLAVGLSLENPQTVFTTGGFTASTYGTANLVTLPNGKFVNVNNAGATGFAPTVNYSDEVAPDVVAKVAWDPGWGHYELYGIARFLHDRVDYVGGGQGETTPAGGIGAATILPLVPDVLTLQGSVLAGYGIGRYGAGQLPDATIRPNGSPWPIPEIQALVGLVGHPIPTVDLYAYFGTEQEDKTAFIEGGKGYGYGNPLFVNSGCDVELSPLTCTGNTSGLTEGTVGVWWRFLHGNYGMMELGGQYAYVRRNVFPGVGGEPSANENMVMVSFRYYPFQ